MNLNDTCSMCCYPWLVQCKNYPSKKNAKNEKCLEKYHFVHYYYYFWSLFSLVQLFWYIQLFCIFICGDLEAQVNQYYNKAGLTLKLDNGKKVKKMVNGQVNWYITVLGYFRLFLNYCHWIYSQTLLTGITIIVYSWKYEKCFFQHAPIIPDQKRITKIQTWPICCWTNWMDYFSNISSAKWEQKEFDLNMGCLNLYIN